MIFTLDVTTPKNTSKVNAVVSPLSVNKGIVYKMEVEFPPGNAGLHYVSIWDGGHRVWPSTPGLWFHSSDRVISFDDSYFKWQAPYIFNVVTYNLDDTYDHFTQVRIGLVSDDIFISRFFPAYTINDLIKTLESIEVKEKEIQEIEDEDLFPWLPKEEDETD